MRWVQQRLRGETQGVLRPQVRPATNEDLAALAALPVEGLDWKAL